MTQRAAGIADITYTEVLPDSANREQMRRAIEQHPVVIVCGETATQLGRLGSDQRRHLISHE